MDGVRCTGSENDLTDCVHEEKRRIGITPLQLNDHAGAECSGTVENSHS